ncbi:DUF799 domain-containing protein [Geopsychrobacter electrodiphilus]|uniref:DUF799 domain-containing protein n=1 Tax=Geopsychrobacter electrodiphilus TaxID=225196 RepID=UPI00037E5B09|nr:GNA1162 family protein [Geopsychrobacter electrodiphilus]
MIGFKRTLIPLLLIFAGLTTGCAPPRTLVSKAEKFPQMYVEQPRSLLVLPPMNESTDAEAKAYYMTTVEMPFALSGYYVFPVEMVSDIMKQEGVYDTELLYQLPLDKFYEYFGADAVLYTHIKKWDVAYLVIASNLTVSIEAEIVSTRTLAKLWSYTGTVVVDLSGGNQGGGLAGLIASAIATAVNTASADYVRYARVANSRLITSLPAGPYNEMYLKDQNDQIVDQTPKQ